MVQGLPRLIDPRHSCLPADLHRWGAAEPSRLPEGSCHTQNIDHSLRGRRVSIRLIGCTVGPASSQCPWSNIDPKSWYAIMSRVCGVEFILHHSLYPRGYVARYAKNYSS